MDGRLEKERPSRNVLRKKKKIVTVFDSVETKRNSSDEYFSNIEDILNSHYFTSIYS